MRYDGSTGQLPLSTRTWLFKSHISPSLDFMRMNDFLGMTFKEIAASIRDHYDLPPAS